MASDFGGGGRYQVLNYQEKFVLPGLTPVHSDAVIRFFDGRVYVVNRLGRDSIQILNPNLANLTIREFSVGPGTNPHDIVLLSPTKAFVSRYNSPRMLIVNPSNGSWIGEIDLSRYSEPTSSSGVPDGLPEMSWMLSFQNRVFVTLQRLDRNHPSGFFPPSDKSLLVEIDPVSNLPFREFSFQVTNPICKPQVVNLFGDPHAIFCSAGFLGFISKLDGGIEAFNLRTNQFRPGFLLEEQVVGGDILDMQIINDELGFASVLDASFNKKFVIFNPSNGLVIRNLLEFPSEVGTNFSGMLLTRNGKLVLSIRDFSSPGIKIFDTLGGVRDLTPLPIRVEISPTDFTELLE